MNKPTLALNAHRKLLVVASALAFTTGYAQVTHTFNYTGATQTLNLTAGVYSIECWGGDGYSQTAGYNGRGGYASGILTLSGSQVVSINVGGKGDYPSGGVTPNSWTFNGGGIGYPASNASYGNGGGATDVRTVGGTWDDPASLAGRVIVAGGGGCGRNTSYQGGHGGGLTGGTGTYFSPDQAGGPTGGTQSSGGSNTGYSSGLTLATLGKAATWDGLTLTASYLAGGGGGYYGGASGRVAGGGGSSYIGGVTSGTTIMYGQPGFVPNPVTTGDGYVLITELCSISLSVAGLGSNGELCEGNSITITTDAVSNYTWTDGSFGPVLVAAPATSTVYGLTAMSPANCITSAQVSITVNPLPVVTATTSAHAICLGQSVVLSADGADTYSWSTNAGTPTITLNPNQTTTYSVTGTNTLTECEFTDMVTVNVLKPTVAIIGNSVICKGNTTTLTALGDGATFYTWSTGSPGQSIVEAPSSHSIYAVTANVSTLNVTCSAVSSFTVLVNPLPNIAAKPDRFVVCLGETVEFSATGGVNYSWSWESETSSAPTFVVAGEQPGKISVNVTGTDANGCSGMASTAVQVNACTGINETLSASEIISVYPNPSQGNVSITVNPAYGGSQLELQMLNETGQLVRTIILNEDNEYKTNLTELNAGLYFLTGNDGSRRISGKITIIN